jgi:hypothetical protein
MQTLCEFPMGVQDIKKNLLSVYCGALAEQFIAQKLRLTQDRGKL